MGAGHFDYLLSSSPQTKIASDRLELLAQSAAKQFLEGTASLNDAIRKFASENDLNRNQIERVCEMANIQTHQALWRKTAQKESLEFPLADSKTIVQVMNPKPLPDEDSPCQPTPSPCSDFAGPPTGIPAPGPSMLSMMGSDPATVHHGLSQEPERKRVLIVIEKKAAERQRLKNEALVRAMELEDAQASAYNQVKQAALAGASFADMYLACAAAGLSKVAEEYLPGFEEKLITSTHGTVRLELEKNAIGKAPADLISDNMGGTTVINGAHPVLVSLDTVQKKTGEVKNTHHNLLRIDDEVKVLKQKVRNLS